MKRATGRLSDFLNVASTLSYILSILAAVTSLAFLALLIAYPEFGHNIIDAGIESLPPDTDSNPTALILLPVVFHVFQVGASVGFLVVGLLLQLLRQKPVFGTLLRIDFCCVLAAVVVPVLAFIASIMLIS